MIERTKKLFLIAICTWPSFASLGQTIDCTPLASANCNHITNNNFTPVASYDPTVISQEDDPFGTNLVPGWVDICGSANIYHSNSTFYNLAPPAVSSGYVSMSSLHDGSGILMEGVGQKIPELVINNTYTLSFFKKRESFGQWYMNNWMDNFYIVLMDCDDYDLLTPSLYNEPPFPSNSQVIYCETNIRNTTWQQVVVNFVPNAKYDLIVFYPKMNSTTTPGQGSRLLMSFPEIVDRTNGISAGSSPSTGNCQVTIGPNPLNCSVANIQFTWKDPNNNIVYQGPNQTLNLNMATAPTGTYTLSMSVPGATPITTNTCSSSTPTYTATVNVPVPTCSCSGLQIIDPEVSYFNTESASVWTTQSVSTCSTSPLCHNANEYIEITASSPYANGNAWEIFVTNYQGQGYQFQGNTSLPYNTNPVSTGQNVNAAIILDPLSYGVVELRLTNSNTSQVASVYFRIIPKSAVGDICNSIANPGYKKMLGGPGNIPGHSYSWTFPSGITVINNNVVEAEFNDASYSGPIPTTATLQVANTFGCASYSQNIVYYPNVTPICNSRSGYVEVEENDINKHKSEITIYPNPAFKIFRINAKKDIAQIIIKSLQGSIFKIENRPKQGTEINVENLPPGIYLVEMKFLDKTSKAIKLVKL